MPWLAFAGGDLYGRLLYGRQPNRPERHDRCALPARVRNTGMAWALGIGRLGGIKGPWQGGLLLDLGLPPRHIFLVRLCDCVRSPRSRGGWGFGVCQWRRDAPVIASEAAIRVNDRHGDRFCFARNDRSACARRKGRRA